MTVLGKATVITGISIFTLSTLAWIIQGNWQWFAGGAAIFLGTLLTGAVISAETKPSPTRSIPSPPSPPSSESDSSDPNQPYTYTYSATDRPPNSTDTLPDWTPPPTPPPDDPDPFSRPSLVPPPTN
jgi:hypothetical protein